MMTVKPGDRIRLTAMRDDLCPVPLGTWGTVKGACDIGSGRDKWSQIVVNWDGERTRNLVAPPDTFDILPSDGAAA